MAQTGGISIDIMEKWLKDDVGDINIVCKDGNIKAVSYILIYRSEYFKKLLEAPMKEGLSKKIEFLDMREYHVQYLLRYLYLDEINIAPSSSIAKMYSIFHKFQLFDACYRIQKSSVRHSHSHKLLGYALDYYPATAVLCLEILKKIVIEDEKKFNQNYTYIGRKAPLLIYYAKFYDYELESIDDLEKIIESRGIMDETLL